ncbi:MAG: DnaD domain protein [bacterium]
MERVRRNDQFFAYAKTLLSTADLQTLTLLYQPLVGVSAFTFYLTLFGLLNKQTLISEKFLHSDLESILDIKLEKLEEARQKLEAIGLLTAWFKTDTFAYELVLPMSAASFVNDGVLGQYLQAAVTEDRYKKLIKLFKTTKVTKDGYIDITKGFDEMFPGMPPAGVDSESDLARKIRSKSIKIRNSAFDFRLFAESIPAEFFDKDQLTDSVRDKIDNLAFVYGLDEMAMKNAWVKAVEPGKPVDATRLAAAAREGYKTVSRTLEKAQEDPAQPSGDAPDTSDPIVYFQAISPKELLKQMSGGKVAAADLRIVERLLNEIGIDKGVVNVMLAYVLENNHGDMPSYDYFEKIGLSWLRNKVDTVEIAIDYVKHLNAEYVKNKETGAARRPSKYAKEAKPDYKIDWLDEYMKSIQ